MSSTALSPELIAAIEAGACVLTPSHRGAHWLRVLYANHAVAQGRDAWATPAIHAFNAFASQLWRNCKTKTHERRQRVLTAEQARCVWERIVLESKWSEQLLSPQAAAVVSFRSWERLQAFAIERDALLEAAQATEHVEAQALLEWSDCFAARCRERGWLPVQWLPSALLAHSHAVEEIVTLTDDWLPNQRALLDHLVKGGARWRQIELPCIAADRTVCWYATAQTELQGAAEWARERLASGSESIAIVVPRLGECAEQVRRTFSEVFAQSTRTLDALAASDRQQQEASFALASYRVLGDFPLVQAALDMLRLAAGQASASLVGGLLRGPFLAGASIEVSLRAVADAALRQQRRERFDLSHAEQIARRCPILLQRLHDAHAVRLAAPSRALPSAMAEHFMLLWRGFGWPGDQPLTSDEQQVAARLQEALGEFGSLDDLIGPVSFNQAVREFEQWVCAASFEPRSAPAPIVIVDAQGMDELRFDAAWVAGMDESSWPPAPTPDPFIPLSLQATANMPGATARLTQTQARRRFEQLGRMASRVVFSWARQDGDVDVLPSPWLRELGPAQACDLADDSYAARMLSMRPTLELVEEARAPALASRYARGGSRIFELQSQCPFRAFAELRLGAQPLDEVGTDVDARERGTLIHAALADIWRTLRDSSQLQAKSDAELETLVRTALAKHAMRLTDGASPQRVRLLQIEQDIAADRIMALLQLDKGRTPFKVAGLVESKEEVAIGTLAFELRLDRMDELVADAHAGERIVIDYKTGNNISSTSWTSDRPEQPQLPLYAVTHPNRLSAVSFITLGAKGVGYQGVACDDDVLPGIKAFGTKKSPPLDSWEGLLEHWQRVIERLAEEFVGGHASVDPLPNACRYCHLKSLCRVAEQELVALDDEGSS